MKLKLSEEEIKNYLDTIPIGKENAISYPLLCLNWKVDEREARRIMHELSLYDSGDEFILIRSSKSAGFYRTDDREEIKKYRLECLNKGRSCFAPVKKINRILKDDLITSNTINFFNNLKNIRLAKGLKQTEVIEKLKEIEPSVDVSLLSKFENSVCVPTPTQLIKLASIYECSPSELISLNDFVENVS